MFDTTTADYKAAPDLNLGNAELNAHSGGHRAAIWWEEHCVECGQPECFRSCVKYVRGFDGKCKRFRYGVKPVDASGKTAFAVSFKPWAKLEGVYSGCVGDRCYRILQKAELAIGGLARNLNRLMSFIPGRIGAITIWRRIRKWITGIIATQHEGAFSLKSTIWASKNVDLTFVVIGETKEKFVSHLVLSQGVNKTAIDLPSLVRGDRLLLFPVSETDADVVFYEFDVVCNTNLASQPAAKNETATCASSAPFVKCLVWDLDNTLWDGILAEDGPDKLKIRQSAVALIKTLDKRGILNSVCSKNDFSAAWPVLERFGIAEYFVFPQINWHPKSSNIARMAKEINIGLDTFAFIDDSAFERGEVHGALPMIQILRDSQVEDIAAMPRFSPPISDESAKRRFSYLTEMKRREVGQSYEGDYEGFLRNCAIELSLEKIEDESTMTRCWELAQRSNQLTLTANRCEKDEFAAMLSRAEIVGYAIRCKDRFGEYGIVGFVAIENCPEETRMVEFVMSCRVAKKKCEQSVVRALLERNAFNSRRFVATLKSTGRNGALIEAFDAIPFQQEMNGETRRYLMPLPAEGISTLFSNKVVFRAVIQ